MRTLTLGVLIVSGGTLAAPPFRRYQAIPDASSAPVHVTGPTHSVLDGSESKTGAFRMLATGESEVDLQMVAANLPRWPEPVAPQPPRRIDIPLSYEDLALPIDQPVPIEQRFNATATVRKKQLERERVAGLVMPAMESLAASQQEELQRAADVLPDDPAAPHASATLASTTFRDKQIERLPKVEQVERDRQWIRQPE